MTDIEKLAAHAATLRTNRGPQDSRSMAGVAAILPDDSGDGCLAEDSRSLLNGHSQANSNLKRRRAKGSNGGEKSHEITRNNGRTKSSGSLRSGRDAASARLKGNAKSPRDLLALGAITGAEIGATVAMASLQNPAMLKPDQLLERYDPEEPANAIGRQLGVVTGGKRFLVFDEDSLNRELSKAELHRLLRGFPDREIAIFKEIPHQTFAVGHRPQRYTDQCPWDGLALYNGESNDGVAWIRLPKPTRRLIFIASQLLALPELQKYAELELFRLLAKAESRRKGSSFIIATRLFPSAFIQYRDYERQEHLPPLKVAIGGA
jgi:hypothetical protein